MKFELQEDLGNLNAIDEPARSALLQHGAAYLGWSPQSQVIAIPHWDATAVTKQLKVLKRANPSVKVMILTIGKTTRWSYTEREEKEQDEIDLYYQPEGQRKFWLISLSKHKAGTDTWLPSSGVEKAWFVVGDDVSIKKRTERQRNSWNNDPLNQRGTYDRDKTHTTFDFDQASLLVNARLEELKDAMISKFARILDDKFDKKAAHSMGVHITDSDMKMFQTFIYASRTNGRISREDLVKMLREIKSKKSQMLR